MFQLKYWDVVLAPRLNFQSNCLTCKHWYALIAMEETVQNILARADSGIIARLARQGQRNLLGGIQMELSECGIILGVKAMNELYFVCKWRHFVIALSTLRRNELPSV